MCIFWIMIFWEIKLQSSDLIWSIKFLPPPLSLFLHSSSPIFKLLFMVSYGSELVIDSSSPWSGIFNHLSSSSIPLPLIFKKQRIPLMNKIQGLQALHGVTSIFWSDSLYKAKSQIPNPRIVFDTCLQVCWMIKFYIKYEDPFLGMIACCCF